MKKIKLSKFREDPDNVSEATDEDIARLAAKLKRVPLGLTAMRIAYVTDAPGGGCMVISGNKRLRCLKAAYGEGGKVPADWFQDITAMSEAERHEFRLNANISDGSFDAAKLLEQYTRDDLAALMSAEAIDELCKQAEKETNKEGETEPQTGTNGFNYKEQYGVIVMCKDEADQEKIYNRLTGEGFVCKVVAT